MSNAEILEEELKAGNTVICYDCDYGIKQGDKYVIKDGKMYCEECGSER